MQKEKQLISTLLQTRTLGRQEKMAIDLVVWHFNTRKIQFFVFPTKMLSIFSRENHPFFSRGQKTILLIKQPFILVDVIDS